MKISNIYYMWKLKNINKKFQKIDDEYNKCFSGFLITLNTLRSGKLSEFEKKRNLLNKKLIYYSKKLMKNGRYSNHRERTLDAYPFHIKRALNISKGLREEFQYTKESISNAPPQVLLNLERIVKESTGDPEVKLI